ncbi:DNA-3-methyladenine glycosylase I [Metabacillus iocasae]|uniref:DNA-3-methyladenine glycosylase I n=1 Tax=Priestia iocasae TaxID=2291674 RepID=A0ABS2QS10_9BACI|nr:DNA-3-methyladenine glycosylase I [Metabacillus iocasae]MBM7702255.1 DNA-3-methyladenine glycosylase I [Metabacillus iocasae]
MKRCDWVTKEEIYIQYHDEEWGVPVYEDRKLFEMLNLEGAQAGLSWITVLRKRERYREVFDHFEAEKIIQYDEAKVEELLQDPGIIRNRLKVKAVIRNAKAFLQIQQEFGSFSDYIWSFVGGKPVINKWDRIQDVPTSTAISDAMSKDLKKRGFSFVGSTICYAFMQATGMVHDHLTTCVCYKQKAAR